MDIKEEFYNTGELKAVMEYNGAECKKVGFYRTGEVEFKETYLNGKLVGEKKYYYVSKMPLATEHYINGKLEGEKKTYCNTGRIVCVETYKNGNLHGKKIYYSENNKIESEESYVDGKLDGISNFYGHKDTLIKSASYKNGLLDGLRTTNNVGTLNKIVEENYKLGKLHGFKRIYCTDTQDIKNSGGIRTHFPIPERVFPDIHRNNHENMVPRFANVIPQINNVNPHINIDNSDDDNSDDDLNDNIYYNDENNNNNINDIYFNYRNGDEENHPIQRNDGNRNGRNIVGNLINGVLNIINPNRNQNPAPIQNPVPIPNPIQVQDLFPIPEDDEEEEEDNQIPNIQNPVQGLNNGGNLHFPQPIQVNGNNVVKVRTDFERLDKIDKHFLQLEEIYENGKLNGKRTLFYGDRIIDTEELYKDGLLDGITVIYHRPLPNNIFTYIPDLTKKQKEFNNDNDQELMDVHNDNLVILDPNNTSSKEYENTYSKGIKIKSLKFDRRGILVHEENYVNDKLSGIKKTYRANSKLFMEENYLYGHLNGKRTIYNENDSKTVETYEYGKLSMSVSYDDKNHIHHLSKINEKGGIEYGIVYHQNGYTKMIYKLGKKYNNFIGRRRIDIFY